MKFLDRESLTQKSMEEICDCVKRGSRLRMERSRPFDHDFFSGNELNRLIDKGLINEGSHLQQGIDQLFYGLEGVDIRETPLQYPDNRLIKAVEEGDEPKDLLGPMTGVFAHVFQNDVYAVHVRGQGISAPGKIQIAAGMGEYGVYPAVNALKEVREELGMDAELVLPYERFLDVTPFMKAGKFSQPLFFYIATGDLNHITRIVRNNNELENFVTSMSEDKLKEAYPFLVPMENLRDFLTEVDEKDKFYGSVKRTAFNFLDWYNQEFEKSY